MNLRNLVSNVTNKLNKVVGTAKANLNDWGKVISNPSTRSSYINNVAKPTLTRVIQTPSRGLNNGVNLAKMATNPFGRAQIADTIKQKVLPNVAFNKQQFYGVGDTTPKWEDLSSQEQKKIGLMDLLDDLTHPRVKDSTSQVIPYFQAPNSDIKPNAIRDELVNKGGYTKQVQNYLKKIGIIDKPENSTTGVDWSAGGAFGGKYSPKFIELSPNNGGYNPHVTGHELTHQIDFVAKSYKPEEFINSVYEAAKTNPSLQSTISFIEKYKKDQPEYFGVGENSKNYQGDINELRNKTLASELFAELGSQVGPSLLKDPILSKFYKGIFQETPENYSGWVTPGPTPNNPNAPKPTIAPIKNIPLTNSGTSVPSLKKASKIILRKVKK